jgi:hypothetical protein
LETASEIVEKGFFTIFTIKFLTSSFLVKSIRIIVNQMLAQLGMYKQKIIIEPFDNVSEIFSEQKRSA